MYTSYEGMCVEFERKKQHNIDIPTFNFASTCKTYFMTHPLNIIISDFGIGLLGLRIELSCLLYNLQGHYCLSTTWL